MLLCFKHWFDYISPVCYLCCPERLDIALRPLIFVDEKVPKLAIELWPFRACSCGVNYMLERQRSVAIKKKSANAECVLIRRL